jgi:hypothetical protein
MVRKFQRKQARGRRRLDVGSTKLVVIWISNNSESLNAFSDKGNPQSGSWDGEPIDKAFHNQQLFYGDCWRIKWERKYGRGEREDVEFRTFFAFVVSHQLRCCHGGMIHH